MSKTQFLVTHESRTSPKSSGQISQDLVKDSEAVNDHSCPRTDTEVVNSGKQNSSLGRVASILANAGAKFNGKPATLKNAPKQYKEMNYQE